MDYETVIGLETHVQLKTRSKMWCGCAHEFGAPPNTNVCPVCLGLPGVLPVANEEALRLTVLTGFLLNCTVARHAKFDRKNYFYPDVPQNSQITQFDKPSSQIGYVDFCSAWNRVLDPLPILSDEFFSQLGLNCRLGLLSNTDLIHSEYLERNFSFMQHFPTRIYSCGVGACKPSAAIFQAALKALGVPATAALYIDDVAEFAEAARQLGLDAICFEGPLQLKNELLRRGIASLIE